MIRKLAKQYYMKWFPERFKQKSFGALRKFNWKDIGVLNIEAEFLLLEFFLRSNDCVFFDVGANIGQYTDKASQYLKPENIYAFEPNPALVQRLKFLFRRSQIFQLALSSSDGIAELTIPEEDGRILDTRASLLEIEKSGNMRSFVVKTMTLDTFCTQYQLPRIDLIKIDVEGFELEVFKGAFHTLEKFKPVMIVEIDGFHYNKSLQEVFQTIELMGYEAYYFESHTNQILPVLPAQNWDDLQLRGERGLSKSYINNFILIHQSKNPLDVISDMVGWIKSKQSN